MPVQVVAAQFTSDGRTDLAVAHNQAGSPSTRRGVTLLLNQGGMTFASSEIATGLPVGGIAVADFNKNGHEDIVVTENTAPGAVDLFTGDGQGNFTAAGKFDTGITMPGPIAVADFNNDGNPDVVVASTSADPTKGGIAVLLNQLGSSFAAPKTFQVFPGTALNGLAVSDVNADGNPDAIVTTLPGTTGTRQDNAFVVLGKGGGLFGNVIPYEIGLGPGGNAPTAVAVGGTALVRASTFTVAGDLIEIDLVNNGDFETPDLSGNTGNLTGWLTYNLPDNPGGSHGAFASQTGTTSPLSGVTVPPPPSAPTAWPSIPTPTWARPRASCTWPSTATCTSPSTAASRGSRWAPACPTSRPPTSSSAPRPRSWRWPPSAAAPSRCPPPPSRPSPT